MSTLAEQFLERDKNKPNPKYNYGDRVSGLFGKKMVIGMVIREHYNPEEKSVLLHLDLPLKIEGDYKHVLYIPIKSCKKLVDIKG